MIRKGLFIMICLGLGLNTSAQQNVQEILKTIRSNNLEIRSIAIEKQMNLLEDKKSLIPDDPELSYAYLWGSPSFIGNRQNVHAGQRVKFPSYYSRQKNVNEISADLYNLQQESGINRVLYESLDLLLNFVSLQIRRDVMVLRMERLDQIRDLASKKLMAGEGNRIEFEKASLLSDTYRQDFLMIQSQENILKRKLASLNGGMDINVALKSYDPFEKLFGKRDAIGALTENPVIEAANLNIKKAEAGISLAKTSYLPDLQLAYLSEAIREEKLAGVELGLSIPLWGKSNQVKKARLNKEFNDNRKQLTDLYIQKEWDDNSEMAKQSYEIKSNLEKSLGELKSIDLLEQSWKLGEISLLEYLLELPFYYEVEDRLMEAEEQYYKFILNRNRNHLSAFLE